METVAAKSVDLAATAIMLGMCFNMGSIYTCIEQSYESLFRMKQHEVNGFRRMRTITQLMFESLIQFAVQIHMLVYFNASGIDPA